MLSLLKFFTKRQLAHNFIQNTHFSCIMLTKSPLRPIQISSAHTQNSKFGSEGNHLGGGVKKGTTRGLNRTNICDTSIVSVGNVVCILWLITYPSHSFIDKLHHTALHIYIYHTTIHPNIYQTYTHTSIPHIQTSMQQNHISTPRIEKRLFNIISHGCTLSRRET